MVGLEYIDMIGGYAATMEIKQKGQISFFSKLILATILKKYFNMYDVFKIHLLIFLLSL